MTINKSASVKFPFSDILLAFYLQPTSVFLWHLLGPVKRRQFTRSNWAVISVISCNKKHFNETLQPSIASFNHFMAYWFMLASIRQWVFTGRRSQQLSLNLIQIMSINKCCLLVPWFWWRHVVYINAVCYCIYVTIHDKTSHIIFFNFRVIINSKF